MMRLSSTSIHRPPLSRWWLRTAGLVVTTAGCAFGMAQAQAQAQTQAPQTQTQMQMQMQSETSDLVSPPLPAAPRPLRIDAPVEQRLANGLRVVLAERRGVQLVTTQLLALSGSEADPPERAGLAAMTAALLTKGTRRHSAAALASAAESLGGSLDSGAGWDRSQVAITVSVPKLDAALGLLSEAVRQPTFAQAELDRLRTQSLDELKVAYTRPGTLATLTGQHLLFGNGPYGRPAAGTPTSLPRITRSDLLALHAATFRPDNAVMVFAGDLDAGGALRLAQRYFGDWKAPSMPPALARSPAARPQSARSPVAPTGAASGDIVPALPSGGLSPTAAVIDMPQSGQAAVVLTAALPPLGADRPAAAVLNAVLGGGFSSRLSQEIRIKRGLSYSAGSQLDARRGPAALQVVVQTKNPSAPEVVSLMQAELDRLIAAPVGEDELAARKATLIGGFSRAVETTGGLASAVSSLIVAGLPPEALRTRIQDLGAVRAADVQRLAAANLGPAQRRLVVAGEAASFVDGLKAQAPGLTVVPADSLDLERGDRLLR